MALLNDVSTGATGDDQDKKIESLVKQINEQNRLISNEDRTKIIKDASGTPRILFGEGPDQFYGMKVSQEGFDVTGAADSELVFNSSQNVFKIVMSGTTTIPAYTMASAGVTNTYTGSSTVVSIAHNLGYRPAVLAFIDDGTYFTPIPRSISNAGGTGGGMYTTDILVGVTSTAIEFTSSSVGYGAYSFAGQSIVSRPVRYYLLQETAN